MFLQLKPTKIASAMAITGMLAIGNNAQAQTFGTVQKNPFSLTRIGSKSFPTFVDLDGDGDFDLFSGEADGSFIYFENTGTSSVPSFDAAQTNPFSLANIKIYASPNFVDLDNDGDLDMMSGEYGGDFLYFENIGTSSVPSFGIVQTNPFSLTTNIGNKSTPTFVDLDNDGDFDMISGEHDGNFNYFENTGTASVPSFDTVQANPFSLTDIGSSSTQAFVDLDGDGDLDMLSGEDDGSFYYFENIGTISVPSFGSVQTNFFSLSDIGSYSTSAFVDLDNDGDFDIISGDYLGNFNYFENTTTSTTLSTDDVIVNEAELAVYPNPATSIVTINVAEQFIINSVSILNVLGKEVLRTVHNSNIATLQVEDLISGIYVVNINTNKGTITEKLVIE